MHHPANLTAREERRLDRLEDVGSALTALRKAIERGDRISIETFCWTLARRLAVSPIDGNDQDEICGTIGLIEARVKFGIHERLRQFLLPLVAALEGQIEEAEKDL
ncbi:MAG: hypothetical protein ACLP9L_34380 [Thermoguttaceae bacterium]